MPTVQADAALQAETSSPKIPAIEVKSPSFTNTVSKHGVEGSSPTPQKGTGSQPWDSVSDLSETNVREKFVDLGAGPTND